MHSKQRARQALEDWMGAEPDLVVEARTGRTTLAEVLVFDGSEDDAEDDDLPLHYLATAGLSAREGGAELVMCVQAQFEVSELKDLAQWLAALAVSVLRGERTLKNGDFVPVGDIPVFEDMSWLWVTPWGDGDGVISDTDPPVRLLSINPLYAEEVEKLRGLELDQALELFDQEGSDLDDPFRAPLGTPPLEQITPFDLAKGLESFMSDVAEMAQQALAEAQTPPDEPPIQAVELVPVEDELAFSSGFDPGWVPTFPRKP